LLWEIPKEIKLLTENISISEIIFISDSRGFIKNLQKISTSALVR
jgi:hypothetical protein